MGFKFLQLLGLKLCMFGLGITLNPLSPNRDQHQISLCNINTHATSEVLRIKDMITQGEFSHFLPSTFIRKVWGQNRRICCLIVGVKGLI